MSAAAHFLRAYSGTCLGKDDERAQAAGPHSSCRRFHTLADLRGGALPSVQVFYEVRLSGWQRKKVVEE